MSLTRQGYQQSAAVAAGLDSQMEGMADKPATKLGKLQRQTQATSAESIPGYYHSVDSTADTYAAYRASAAGVGVDNTPSGAALYPEVAPTALGSGYQVSLTDKDIAYFEKTRQENLQAEYDDWVTYNIDLSNPGEARWLQQMYPEFWARREKYLDDKINVEARAAKIRLRGIKDQSDLKFLFAADKGYLTLPSSPAFASVQNEYVAGWFRQKGKANDQTFRPNTAQRAAFMPGGMPRTSAVPRSYNRPV